MISFVICNRPLPRAFLFLIFVFSGLSVFPQTTSSKKDKMEGPIHDFLFQNENPYPKLPPHVMKPKHLDYFTLNKTKIYFYVRGYRGIYIKDNITGKVFDGSVGGGGNTEIREIYVLDEEKRLVIADVINFAGDDYYVLYDMTKGEEVQTVFTPPGIIFPFYNQILFYEFRDNHDVDWYITDPLFENKIRNALTEELRRKQISFMDIKNINTKHRVLIGDIDEAITGKDHLLVAVTWNEDFTEAKTFPLIQQRVHEGQYSDEVAFSPSGDWLVWEVNGDYTLNDIEQVATSEVYFYKINPEYEEVVLYPPIYGGIVAAERGFYKSTDMDGVFKYEKSLGECFKIENYKYFDDRQLLYPMSKLDMAYNKHFKEYRNDLEYSDEYHRHVFTLYDTMVIKYDSKEPIFFSAQSFSGEYVVTQDWDRVFTVFNTDEATGLLQETTSWVPDSIDRVKEVIFTDDEKNFFILPRYSNSITFCDIRGNVLQEYHIDSLYEKPSAIYVSRNNEILVATASGHILIANIDSDAFIETYELDPEISFTPTCVGISPDGHYLACGTEYSYVYIIDRETKESRKFDCGLDDPSEISLSNDNKYIALRQKDDYRYIRLFSWEGYYITTLGNGNRGNLESQGLDMLLYNELRQDSIKKFYITNSEDIWKLAVSPSDKHLAYLDSGGNMFIINELERQIIKTDKGKTFENIAFSPSGEYIAVTGKDLAVRFYNLQGKCFKTWYGITLPANKLYFSEDGQKLYVSSYCETACFNMDGKITDHQYYNKIFYDYTRDHTKGIREGKNPICAYLADTRSGEKILSFTGIDEKSTSEAVFIQLDEVDRVPYEGPNDLDYAWFSPKDSYCALVDDNTRFYLYNMEGNLLLSDNTNNTVTNHVAFTEDERYVAYHCYHGYVSDNKFRDEYLIKVYDLKDKRYCKEFYGTLFSFSPDSKSIYVHTGGTIEKYNLERDSEEPEIIMASDYSLISREESNMKYYAKFEEQVSDAVLIDNELIVAFDYYDNKIYKYSFPDNEIIDSIHLWGQNLLPVQDGNMIFTYRTDDTVRVFQKTPFSQKKEWGFDDLRNVYCHEQTGQLVCISTDSWEDKVQLYAMDIHSDRITITKTYGSERYDVPVATSLTIPGYFVSLEKERFSQLHIENFNEIWSSPEEPGYINTIACDGGSMLYVGGSLDNGWFDGFVSVWDMSNRELVARFEHFNERIENIQTTEKLGIILIQDEEKVILFNTFTNQILKSFSIGREDIKGMYYGNNGLLVIHNYKEVAVYSIFE